jgi:hypothetical protein
VAGAAGAGAPNRLLPWMPPGGNVARGCCGATTGALGCGVAAGANWRLGVESKRDSERSLAPGTSIPETLGGAEGAVVPKRLD